jgi:hypothetical protein
MNMYLQRNPVRRTWRISPSIAVNLFILIESPMPHLCWQLSTFSNIFFERASFGGCHRVQSVHIASSRKMLEDSPKSEVYTPAGCENRAR